MRKAVLAVDDFAMSLRMIQEALSDKVDVYIAKSGESAFRTLQSMQIDLILLDIEMPEMDGFEFLRRLRNIEKYKQIPVIIVSAKGSTDFLMKAASYEIKEYLLKPYKTETLCEKVEQVLNMGSM